MHFEILIEDQSGKKTLEILLPKIIGKSHTFKIHPYYGIGKIPKNLTPIPAGRNRILLTQLPRLLRGYGKTFASYSNDYQAAVILVCDLDNKSVKAFRNELDAILNNCNPKPQTRFCFAIEEGEAWFLGDIPAIKTAYPKAKNSVLTTYINDSIVGTWEKLADAVFPGGAAALKAKGWQTVGAEKSKWAEKISPHMDVKKNSSPSFEYFQTKILELANQED